MTDKDNYDYCAHCDVEPPALKFKCPECEHNTENENFAKDINVPSKEQIIIHGVDVSECLFYQSNFEEDYDVKIKHFCSNWHNSCESVNNSNCYYKQLARKTQECEELKKNNKIICDLYESVDLCLQKRTEKFDSYRKALEEIEEIVKINCEEICGRKFEDCNDFLCRSKNIIDIINKAKGEGND